MIQLDGSGGTDGAMRLSAADRPVSTRAAAVVCAGLLGATEAGVGVLEGATRGRNRDGVGG